MGVEAESRSDHYATKVSGYLKDCIGVGLEAAKLVDCKEVSNGRDVANIVIFLGAALDKVLGPLNRSQLLARRRYLVAHHGDDFGFGVSDIEFDGVGPNQLMTYVVEGIDDDLQSDSSKLDKDKLVRVKKLIEGLFAEEGYMNMDDLYQMSKAHDGLLFSSDEFEAIGRFLNDESGEAASEDILETLRMLLADSRVRVEFVKHFRGWDEAKLLRKLVALETRMISRGRLDERKEGSYHGVLLG